MIEMFSLVHLHHHHHHHPLDMIEIVVIIDQLVEVVVHQEKSLVVTETEIEIGTEIDDDHDQGKVSIESTYN